MAKTILPLTVLLATACLFAADVEINGNVKADYASYFDKDFSPTNAANQDINLDFTAYMDENFSVKVNTRTRSSYLNDKGERENSEVRHGLARATAINDSEGRYTAFYFDGIQFRWEFTPGASLLFGDLTYNAGAFNYYYWRDTERYAAIKRDETVRGLGMELGDGRIYIGAAENNVSSLIVYGSYPFEILSKTDQHFVITPSADWAFGDDIDRSYTYFFGTEISYSRSLDLMNYAILVSWGTHPYQGTGVHTFLVEPSFSYDFFNIGLTFFHAILADDNEPVEKQIFTDEQTLFAFEPSFSLHKKFAIGLAYEFHDPSNEIDDDEVHFVGPNFYFYPTANAELVFWGGYNKRHIGANTLSFGISGQVDF
ncbi:MAG: hypothetical protein UHC59_00540 [Fibrobacteraceae bacterium]|jgi:hypothetical protein|nr:hypothetical protein [Fibrobacteraceae bacterium]MEE1275459.1 hypothetical protein [Fibrobacteraceae bacterium]